MGGGAAEAGAPAFCRQRAQEPSSSATAAIAPRKPIFEWVPSQNGLFDEAPQRHRKTVSPGVWIGLPSGSSSSIGPSTL